MQRMLSKRFLIPIAGAILLVAISWVVNPKVVDRGSSKLTVVPFGFNYNQQPFSGIVYSVSASRFSGLIFVWKGLRHGPDLQWYSNGQRFIERHYEHGVEAGVHKSWFEDGKVLSHKSFKNGSPDGASYMWHKNGQLAEFIVYESGQEVAAKSWTSGGKPFYNYRQREGTHVGLEGDRFCSPLKKRL